MNNGSVGDGYLITGDMGGQRYADAQYQPAVDILLFQKDSKLMQKIVVIFLCVFEWAAQAQGINNVQVQINQDKGPMILRNINANGKTRIGCTAEYAGFTASGGFQGAVSINQSALLEKLQIVNNSGAADVKRFCNGKPGAVLVPVYETIDISKISGIIFVFCHCVSPVQTNNST